MEITSESVLKKPKRLTSVVWNHFERVKKNEVCYAVCIHCTKKLSGSSNSGTTHLRNHLMRCLKRSNFDISQLLVKKRKKDNSHSITNISADEEPRNEENTVRSSFKYEPEPKIEEVISLGSARFEQERSRLDLTRMIILHGYPLSMVDHVMQGKFNEIAQQAGAESGKSLLLDNPDHWNSTYLMLETALEYKAAFSQLQESDTACTMVPLDEEWEWASSICSYLKLFVEIMNVVKLALEPDCSCSTPVNWKLVRMPMVQVGAFRMLRGKVTLTTPEQAAVRLLFLVIWTRALRMRM
ncbi:Zinc finger, BED-type, partial [Dillenia turbinata]